MSSINNQNNNNNNKECKHTVLSIKDRSCTVCGMSRYDQLQNKEKGLTNAEEKELEHYINRKHWGMQTIQNGLLGMLDQHIGEKR